MGNPISATLANIFLCNHESQWLDNCPPAFKPILYRRYVDDTFIIFKQKNDAINFFNYLNNQHPNVTFTKEEENERKLPFLDVLVTKSLNNNLEMQVYRKPTYTGLGLNFLSECSFKYKINNLTTLLSRAFKLSSSYLIFHKEVEFLKNFFNNNGYSDNIFYKSVSKILNKFMSVERHERKQDDQIIYFRFPFISNKINKLIEITTKQITKQYFKNITIRMVFFNNRKIGSLINHKESFADKMCSMIVYKFACPECNMEYVGSSTKLLYTRFFEHKGISQRTLVPLGKPQHSSIRDHCENNC